VRRRELMLLLGSAAAWPLAGLAQQPEPVRRIGVLMPFAENGPLIQSYVRTFAGALGRLGWVEGQNIRIDYRFAAGNPGLFNTYAAELVGLAEDAILASGSPVTAALREQTRTIPIVFVGPGDPVGQGFVQSLARPGGNTTGFSSPDAPVYEKWLQLLKEIAPLVTRVTVIFDPDTSPAPRFNSAIAAAAPTVGMTVTFAPVHDDAGIEEAIGTQAREPGGGLIEMPGGFTVTHLEAITTAAARHRLPLIGAYGVAGSGGLMSYWYDAVEAYARAASYIDRILKGANPVDLPVQQPTKYVLIINLKTAKALGLEIPPTLLARADEVIE
jgi:putative ABC transport system substrate-binding protein